MFSTGFAKVIKQQYEIDIKRREEAEKLFANIESINEAAQSDIFPNITPISLNNGSIGIGYYIAPNFIMTNAHVLPTFESIQNSSITSQGIIENSFHRPDNPSAPDIVLIKIKNPVNNVPGIRKDFSEDTALEKSRLLFVNYNFQIQNFELIPIILASNPGEFPLKYKCLDDTIPQPGCSGSLIIEARVILASKPYWQFRQVSMVYARCDAAASSDDKLLCALPINFDLAQIYQLQTSHDEITHLSAMAAAASIIKDEKQSETLLQEKAKTASQANTQFIEYTSGQTSLDIALPDGLEKLIGSGILPLSASLLLAKNQKKYPKTNFKLQASSLDEMLEDLDILYKEISSDDEIVISKGDNFFSSDLFRLDVGDSSNNEWKIDLQDNTSKGVKIDSKSASSVFAIVLVPKSTDGSPIIIHGEKLVNLLKTSINLQQPCKDNAIAAVEAKTSNKNSSAKKNKT